MNTLRQSLAAVVLLLTFASCQKDEPKDTTLPTATILDFTLNGTPTTPTSGPISIQNMEVLLRVNLRFADNAALKSYSVTMSPTFSPANTADNNWNFVISSDTLTGKSRDITSLGLRSTLTGMTLGQFRLRVEAKDAAGNSSAPADQIFQVTN
jgi:hypothetical protein